ncbi:MAG: GGDEF domain-containing protein [Butyrivibrio sp.]|nr:GGDEF domain-containing protein [Butyrivibrio sp.]
MTGVNLLEIYIANGMAFLLMVGILTSNVFKLQERKDALMLYLLDIDLIICCIVDPIVFTLDGMPGGFVRFILYTGNLWLFITNLFFSPLFVLLSERNTRGKNSKPIIFIIVIEEIIGISILIINFFKPLVFLIDENNNYQRLSLYMVYNIIGMLGIVMAIGVYVISRFKGGRFKHFPIFQFVIPIFIGIVVQNYFYGISLIWPAAAVGLTLMIISMQNMNILFDTLTGIYNRHYLETVRLEGQPFCLMMLDLNNFKSINDEQGHSEGDVALISAADIIKSAIGDLGTVVRYAGDEFVVLLNSIDSEVCENTASDIKKAFNVYNNKSHKPYKLSVSIGWGIFDLSKNSMDEVMKTVDERMYEDKKKYYETHDRRKRS